MYFYDSYLVESAVRLRAIVDSGIIAGEFIGRIKRRVGLLRVDTL